MLIDTHCHLTHERFSGEIPEILERAWTAGVGGIIGIASDLDDAILLQDRIGEVAPLRYDRGRQHLWGTVGVHPHEAGAAPQELRARIEEILARSPGIVAIGECGLDFHYDFTPPEKQREVFRTQIEVAAAAGLPLVVHCRSAEAEMATWIRDAASIGVRGVLHCFPGDEVLLGVAMEAGWNVSFTGMVTFNSFGGAEAVRSVPAGRYMLETDGPYLAPVPMRGKRNEPAFLTLTCDRIAELRGSSPGQVAAETTAAAETFFNITFGTGA